MTRPTGEPKAALLYSEQRKFLHALRKGAKAFDKSIWGKLGDPAKADCAALKKRLRLALKSRQEPRCCYCKRWLLNHASAAPIEHVLSRDTYPQFALHPRNLAIACVDCNSVKGKADWGKFPGTPALYPTADVMTFFHPRHHRYDEHIRFIRMETNRQEFVSYHGLTPQGQHLCTQLLSAVVGKRSLKRSYPALAGWQRTIDDLDAQGDSTDRPELQAFRHAMEITIAERLNDGGKASALWVVPDDTAKDAAPKTSGRKHTRSRKQQLAHDPPRAIQEQLAFD
ncbi:HNH endonuclease [Pseudomonas sp. B14(2022)]|uniref:HNH endonuclease n=1 Tax=Pseudomonas sp. B14(2022) TaxID=2914043 RepID=UPI00142FA214|nr:hypothetical protein [Pseudomonas sp. B14(2022)]NJJ56759.1 hypothetical protein [Pseudomonas sp. B14(2022)]